MARRTFGSIRKLPSKRWQARYIHPDTGATQTAPSTFKSKTDASVWLSEIEVEVHKGIWHDPAKGKVTLRGFSATWMEGRKLTPRTRENYEGLLRLHILPTLGDYELAKLSPAAVRAWHTKLDAQHARQAAAAYSRLRSILNTAVDDGAIPKNPCTIKGAGAIKSTERPFMPFTEFQTLLIEVSKWHEALDEESSRRLEKLVTSATATPEQIEAARRRTGTPDYMRALLAVTFGAHLRLGEVIALKRKDLDLEKRTIRVERQLQELKGGPQFLEPKMEERRTVRIPGPMLDIAREYVEQLPPAAPDAPLFYRVEGVHLRRSHVADRWEQAREAAGLEKFHFHDLRHAGLTIVAQGGATTKEIMARGGHKTARAAMIYQHAAAERDQLVADQFGASMATAIPATEVANPLSVRAGVATK
jgi:integrase